MGKWVVHRGTKIYDDAPLVMLVWGNPPSDDIYMISAGENDYNWEPMNDLADIIEAHNERSGDDG